MDSYRTIMDPNRVQGSMYNLTFDEVENDLGNTNNNVNTGNSHLNMNFDELMKNVISGVQNPTSSFLVGTDNSTPSGGFNGTTLSTNNITNNNNKTFDEVWMEGNNNQKHVTTNAHSMDTNNLGFLTRGGGTINSHGNVAPLLSPPKQLMPMVMDSQPDLLPLQMPMLQMQQQDDLKPVYENQVIGNYPVPVALPMMEATMLASSDKGRVSVGRRNSYTDEMLEKNIERKEKRMAKNRESAARSRAKKQEHINMLREKKFLLETANMRLKKYKEVEERIFSEHLTPKYQLRRTSSSP